MFKWFTLTSENGTRIEKAGREPRKYVLCLKSDTLDIRRELLAAIDVYFSEWLSTFRVPYIESAIFCPFRRHLSRRNRIFNRWLFFFSVAEDGTGRWALRNVTRGYFLGSSSDKLTCTAKAPGEAEFWHVHLAARPQVVKLCLCCVFCGMTNSTGREVFKNSELQICSWTNWGGTLKLYVGCLRRVLVRWIINVICYFNEFLLA